MRGRAKPDGMCLVVGSCAEGYKPEANIHADLLYTLGDARDDMQVCVQGRLSGWVCNACVYVTSLVGLAMHFTRLRRNVPTCLA